MRISTVLGDIVPYIPPSLLRAILRDPREPKEPVVPTDEVPERPRIKLSVPQPVRAAMTRLKQKLGGLNWRRLNPFPKFSFSKELERLRRSFIEEPWECAATALGILVVLFFIISMMSRCVR